MLRKIFENCGWVSGQNPVVSEDSEPDVAVYRRNFRDYFAHPRPADALLVVEVAVSSLVKDTAVKADCYSQEGVVDYWAVDVEHRELLVLHKPSVTGYQSKQTLADSESVSPLAALTATVRFADLLP